MRRYFMIVLATMLVGAVAAGVALAADNAATGKTLWAAKTCKNCHGEQGEGKSAMPLAASTLTAADWVKQARTPRAHMPAYSPAQVSDQDLADMLAYMKTLPAPPPWQPSSYRAEGDGPIGWTVFYQKGCVACHSTNIGPFLKARYNAQGRTLAAADVIKQLRTPAANMPMFSETQVSIAEANQMTDYFKMAIAAAPPTAPSAAPAAALPKTGDQLPLAQLALAGLLLIGSGFLVRFIVRRPV